MRNFIFKRPKLAAAYCDSLAGKGIADARSGLFLAGPRRVGKTTFLQEELIPEAEKQGWVPIYVDLWSKKNINPSNLIEEAVKEKIAFYEGKLAKLAKGMRLEKIKIMGTFVIDFTQPGFPENITLAQVLHTLHKLAGKPIFLVIDEAQHALTTDEGLNTLFAIKSARDQMNVGLEKIPSLMLVFTGSNRDKLGNLLLKKSQPFFGSEIITFPLLDKDYTDAFTDWVNKSLSSQNQFSKANMWQAFKLVGHRPEILRQLASRIALSGDAKRFSEVLEKDALIWHEQIWGEYENDFSSLTVLQQAILTVLIDEKNLWSPFSEQSMGRYKQITGQQEISTATVQTAIQGLRERDLIWQSGRGAYSLEDEGFGEWFKHSHSTTSDVS